MLIPDAAHADPGLTVSPATTTRVVPNSTTTLSGLSVAGDNIDTLQVTVATNAGTVSIPTNMNLTLAYDNSWSGDPSITFTGAQSDIDTALATTQLVTTSGDAGSTASVSLQAMISQPGYIYSPLNGHFYQYVAAQGTTWPADKTAAQSLTFDGQQGYLATIPSNGINNFVSSKIEGAKNVWFGAESNDTPSSSPARTWQWTGGPLAGQPISYCTNFLGTCDFTNNTGLYSHWADVEPNNSGATPDVAHSGEYVAVTNWSGGVGMWNDLPANNSGASGYVVEYGDLATGATDGFDGVADTSNDVLIAGPPATPTDVTQTSGDGSVAVSFTAPATNGSPITGYTVTTTPGGATTSCSASPCTVTGLTNGTGYTFTVSASNTYGIGTASSASTAVVPAGLPTAPTKLTATRGNASVTLQFTAPGDNGSPITGYEYSMDGVNWQTLPTSVAGAAHLQALPKSAVSNRTATITGLTNGTRYSFQVRAVNGIGAGAAAGPASATPGMTPTVPGSLRVYAGDRVLNLRFAPPASDGGSPITAYRASVDGGRHWRTVPTTGTGNVRMASVPGVLNGKTYRVKVRALNDNGAGPATSAVTTATQSWFHDPIGPASRQHEIKVPVHPIRYHGKLRWTTASGRAHNGTPAMPVASLRGRQLQPGQAAALGSGALFAFNSARLNRNGRTVLKSLVRSLRYDKSIVCEGYADYGWRSAREKSLSLRRARVVCATLKLFGAQVRSTTRGYGSKDPVIVGGKPAQRAANRRVVVLVTG